MPKANHSPKKGILYVVATPIGNRDDITLRALKILQQVDRIAAEDTRKSGRFLAHHGIKSQLVSYHEHNEAKRTPQLIEKLLAGSSIALISNAGTPSVSDPGFRLIKAAIEHQIMVTPIPGVSAATAAMSVSGLPSDAFLFVGFAPKKKGKRTKFLTSLGARSESLVFYESPKRIISLIEDIIACMGERNAVLAREMTKVHEEIRRDIQVGVTLFADETGWRVRGKNWWLWVFGTERSAYYTVDRTRGSDVVRRVLGAARRQPAVS